MIDKGKVLSLTQGGLDIFSHYLGFEVNLHRNFRSPFYEDKRASCHIYYDRKTSVYKFYDHGDPTYCGDCFWFVATLLGLNIKSSFPEVMEAIVQSLGLYSLRKGESPRRTQAVPMPKQDTQRKVYAHKPEERPFEFELQPFDDNLLNYWSHYGIFEDTLRLFRVRCLKRYESVSGEGKPLLLRYGAASDKR